MKVAQELKPVSPQSGRPLHEVVIDALNNAIDAGLFPPGKQLPNTKELSRQLSVSLVTTHKALQELVVTGVLDRKQGRGTFVIEPSERTGKKLRIRKKCRISLVFHRESSVADYYHGQIVEGLRQAAQEHAADLMIRHFDSPDRSECEGYLFINPRPDEMKSFTKKLKRDCPLLVVGARSPLEDLPSIDVDNMDLAGRSVEHLHHLGHKRIGYLGGADDLSNSNDRREGFLLACSRLGVVPEEYHRIEAVSWRLSGNEKMALCRILSSSQRPTAIFAAGYYFALDVYDAAAMLGLQIPGDLSVVGVDDPPSAAHLSPPLTTVRQPLAHLGHAALTTLIEAIEGVTPQMNSQVLRPELVIRQSSGAP